MPRVFWTDEEAQLVADKFIEFRLADALTPGIALMMRAQGEALDPNRQRPTANTLLTFAKVVELVEPRWKRLHEKSGEKTTVLAPEVAKPRAAEPAPCEPEPKQLAPTKAPEPLLIEIRAEKTDPSTLLSKCPTGLLLGAAIERLLSLHTKPSTQPTQESVRVEAFVPRVAEPVVALAAPPLVKAQTVEGGSVLLPADGRRRVLVLGLLSAAADMIRQKSAGFGNLDITVLDTGTRADLGAVACDYVIFSREMVTHFQASQIRRRFTDPSRIIHFEGTQDELLRKLAELNSTARCA